MKVWDLKMSLCVFKSGFCTLKVRVHDLKMRH